MDRDEVEMSEEELQNWIKEEVQKSQLIPPDVLEKCNMLQSLLERRQKQAAHLLKLCESVAACEAIVQNQYSLLGWDYPHTNSENDDDIVTSCGSSPQSLCDSVHPDTQDKPSSAANKDSSLTQNLQYSEHLNNNNLNIHCLLLRRKPVVALARLPEFQISALCRPTPEEHCIENEFSSSLDSEIVKEPDENPNYTENSISGFRMTSTNKRKLDEETNNMSKGGETPQAKSNTKTKSNAKKPKSFEDDSASGAKDGTKASTPTSSTNSNANKDGSKTLTRGAQINDKATTKNTSGDTATKRLYEIGVNVSVLARRREMSWQRGKIKEILTKEDGRVKYKVFFENKGKSLVSGHHIALDCVPNVDHLVVGTRVVIEHPDEQEFCPGILAEVPSRKNRMRFLVFTDDHKPFYVALSVLHQVYKPLPDPLDDIINEDHRNFIKEYLERWPYPPQTLYKIGQKLNAELNGTQQKCEVNDVDCSLILVTFQETLQTEWIYRGSSRLEHMINMRKNLETRKNMKF